MSRVTFSTPFAGLVFPTGDRRFPPPWSIEDPDPQLERQCFIVRDHNGQALAYLHFEEEKGRRSAAHLLTRDEAPWIAANIAELPGLLRRVTKQSN
jgi:hypothetical protein